MNCVNSPVFHWIPSQPEWLGQVNEHEYDTLLKSLISGRGWFLDNLKSENIVSITQILNGESTVAIWDVATGDQILMPSINALEKTLFSIMPDSKETMIDHYKCNFGIQLLYLNTPVVLDYKRIPHPIEMISLRMKMCEGDEYEEAEEVFDKDDDVTTSDIDELDCEIDWDADYEYRK